MIKRLESNQIGFTLIESLLSLIIISIIITPFLGSLNQSLKAEAESGKSTQAVYLGSGRMEFLRELTYDEMLNVLNQEKTWEKIDRSFYDSYFDNFVLHNYYEIVAERPEKEQKLIKIKVKVNWYEKKTEREYILSTFLML
ncbi:prepilin-type N-terminal cleavage/methylation domain-containing protein [Natranaerofaba carboxydovora]|uniref:prepilin-type N-terminal cleavage/methylation domain-containing protein n=1 Tax=Natranaerofaba carboxydovora TaxID=2742683 RepID=UPI001F135FEF|nr:prepilin-type N-terminal cleavage/methylation domain-containing protein [Natranaerofaba carboxydovora]UMZ73986.1 hypothetical protein ACONDI_01556 [Natranaerofaba carboxydovora]